MCLCAVVVVPYHIVTRIKVARRWSVGRLVAWMVSWLVGCLVGLVASHADDCREQTRPARGSWIESGCNSRLPSSKSIGDGRLSYRLAHLDLLFLLPLLLMLFDVIIIIIAFVVFPSSLCLSVSI